MGGKHLVLKQKSLVWALLLSVMMFRDAIAQSISAVRYIDEIAALICLAYFVLGAFQKKIGGNDIYIAGVVAVLCFLGFAGNLFSGIQDSLKYQVFDAFNIFKYVMVVWGATCYFEQYRTKEYLISYLATIVKITVLISSVFMVINLFADIGMHKYYRMGIRTFHFIFSRVGEFYNACILWLIILTAERFYRQKEKDYFYIVLVLLNMCATLRTRTMAFAVFYVVLYYLIATKRLVKLHWWHIVPIAAVLFLIGKDQIEYYLLTENRARGVLLKYGFITAKEYFPLGAGFATYGTAVARDTYSSLYSRYDFGAYWGLAEGQGILTDNYWPAVMGEFGFFGVILTAILIFLIYKKLIRNTDNKYSRVCVYFALGTLAIASVAASSFFACARLMLFVCVVCRLNYSQEATGTGGRGCNA